MKNFPTRDFHQSQQRKQSFFAGLEGEWDKWRTANRDKKAVKKTEKGSKKNKSFQSLLTDEANKLCRIKLLSSRTDISYCKNFEDAKKWLPLFT